MLLPAVSRNARALKVLFYSLLAWHIFLFGYNFVDIYFYADTQRHLTYDILYAWKNTGVVFKMGFESFFTEVLGAFLFFGVYGYCYVKFVEKLIGRLKDYKKIVFAKKVAAGGRDESRRYMGHI